MAAEIVAAGIPTVRAVAPMVAEVEVDLAEIEVVSQVVVLTSQASRLDVMSAGTPAQSPLNQTEANRFCAAIVFEETKAVVIHEASIALHHWVVSPIEPKIAHDEPQQDQLQ